MGEALRRVKSGLESIKANYGFLFAMQEETWTGYHLNFRVNVLGQAVYGSIDVREHFVSLRASLPWLLAGLAEVAVPAIRKKGASIYAKKATNASSPPIGDRAAQTRVALRVAEQPYGRRLRALVSGFVGERHARANLQVEKRVVEHAVAVEVEFLSIVGSRTKRNSPDGSSRATVAAGARSRRFA